MKNIRPFQIALLAGFVVAAFVALFLLGNYQAKKTTEELAYGNEVVIWGTLDDGVMSRLFSKIALKDDAFSVVKYRQVDERNFDEDFVNAVAEGRSPDVVILPSEKIVKHRAKLLTIPYENFPLRDFRSLYVDGAEVFTLSDGVYAVPFAVDPLLLYWNRDLFATAGIAEPPATWESVVSTVVPKITVRTDTRDILTSALAFGEYRNVTHAKEVLLMLALQSGSDMVGENGSRYTVGLNNASAAQGMPLDAALRFYTDFSNVNNPLYSWNRVQPNDVQAFTAGDLAMYFGLASEVQEIADRNPNLNFDTALVPQGGAATAHRTYGTFYGFAFPRSSDNTSGAYNATQKIANETYSSELTTSLNMAPVRRSLISAGASNPFRAVTLKAALTARSWLDPEPTTSDSIFKQMVEDVVSNRSRISSAVADAIQRLVLEY